MMEKKELYELLGRIFAQSYETGARKEHWHNLWDQEVKHRKAVEAELEATKAVIEEMKNGGE